MDIARGFHTNVSRCIQPTRFPTHGASSRTRCGPGTSRGWVGRRSGSWFYLYVIIDIYSRYVPGGCWPPPRTTPTPKRCWPTPRQAEHHPGQLSSIRIVDHRCRQAGGVHARRARCHQVPQPAALLERQPVHRSALPHVEVSARVPDRFGSFSHAAQHCEQFFAWYNLEHRHSGIGLHTPVRRPPRPSRSRPCTASDRARPAYAANPERFAPATDAAALPTPSGSTSPTRSRPRLNDSPRNLPHRG